VRSSSVDFSNDPQGYNRREKEKKKMDACYYISMRIYIRICISITTLVFDQLYVQTRNGGKIEPWRKHGMSGEARRRMT